MNPRDPDAPDRPGRPLILFVEDNDSLGRSMEKILESHGFEVIVVTTGAVAVATLRSGTHPDFVLTDLRLPDLDGREVVLAARQLDPPPRVALISGWDVDLGDTAAWGIEWFFPKPLNVPDLVAKLRTPRRGPEPHD